MITKFSRILSCAVHVGLMSLLPAEAQQAQYHPLAEAGRFVIGCISTETCPEGKPAPGIRQADVDRLARQFERAAVWLEALGLNWRDTELETNGLGGSARRYMLTIRPDGLACQGDADAVACNQRRINGDKYIEIPAGLFQRPGDMRSAPVTVAHELFHTFQSRTNAGNRWWHEATASAVGFAHGQAVGLPINWDQPYYPGALDEAAHASSRGGYEHGLFLIHAGRRMKSPHGVKWLVDAARIGPRPMDGLAWLYRGALGPDRFPNAFARFVAAMNADYKSDAAELDTGAWYGITHEELAVFDPPGAPQTERFAFDVAPFAATSVDIALEAQAPEGEDPLDGFAVARIEVRSPAPRGHLRLATEHVLQKGLEAVWLWHADGKARTLAHARVINAGPDIKSTQRREFEIEVTLEAVAAGVPRCLVKGTSFAVFDPEEVEGLEGWRLIGRDWRIEGPVVTPLRTGKLKLSVEIDRTRTRRQGSIREVRLAPLVIPLDPVEVRQEGCMTRLVFPEGDGWATYQPEGDYTEYASEDGAAVYVKEGDLAVYEPGAGWVDIPAELRASMAKEFTASQLGLAGLEPQEITQERMQIHMPLMFATLFEHASIRQTKAVMNSAKTQAKLRKKSGDKTLARMPRWTVTDRKTPCPDGGKGCRKGVVSPAGMARIDVQWARDGRPLTVVMGQGAEFRLEYANFPVRRPPGW